LENLLKEAKSMQQNVPQATQGTRQTYQPIEDYGVIGDLHTVALVGKGWLLPHCPFV
jgi:hypothetical protein